ncbi:Uncharacterised protein [Streptococcus pneumoniae]|nr:Uncharacterised protein [Streptococcus pneumoniae]
MKTQVNVDNPKSCFICFLSALDTPLEKLASKIALLCMVAFLNSIRALTTNSREFDLLGMIVKS